MKVLLVDICLRWEGEVWIMYIGVMDFNEDVSNGFLCSSAVIVE